MNIFHSLNKYLLSPSYEADDQHVEDRHEVNQHTVLKELQLRAGEATHSVLER